MSFGGGITAQVGSAGGVTYSRNRAGAYVKRRAQPVNPSSPSQSAVRQLLPALVKSFNYVLNDSERAAWRTFSATYPTVNRLGNTIYLSGQQAYVKLSSQLLLLGNMTVNTPPVSTAIPTVASLTLTLSSVTSPNVVFNAGVSYIDTACQIIVWFSGSQWPGRNYISSQLRRIPFGQPYNATVDVSAEWAAQFGSFPTGPGQRVFSRACVVNGTTGIVSPYFYANALWT